MPSQDNPTNSLPPVMPTDSSGKSSGTKIKKSTDPVATSPVVVRPDNPTGGHGSQSRRPDDTQRKEELRYTDPARIMGDISNRISESHNILIALSSDPSVDEMSAAIGLTLYLDRIGKRVTTIYSGITPNALEFLKPEDTFEQKADILQDFVIAINKDKADHLRYKLDGDYVKIFITPYHSSISSEDLEFSYGDYNVDLVIALDVANVSDLDDALREHGRIMHDAPVINITNGEPGKLGSIEWSDKSASSISEMLSELVRGLPDGTKIARDEATAFLTGIVAATNRFAGSNTTPRTMEVASRLMSYGANQQLISKNITTNVESEILGSDGPIQKPTKPIANPANPTELNIGHDESKDKPSKKSAIEPTEEFVEERAGDSVGEPDKPAKEVSSAHRTLTPEKQPILAPDRHSSLSLEPISAPETESVEDPNLLADLKAAEATLSNAAAEVTPEAVEQPLRLDPAEDLSESVSLEPAAESSIAVTPSETIVQPEPSDHSGSAASSEPITPAPSPEVIQSAIPKLDNRPNSSFVNPATANAPAAASAPEINGVPEINYMPLPDDEVLPPPPAPPIDFDSTLSAPPTIAAPPKATPSATPTVPSNDVPLQPALPPVESTPTPLGSQPAMQDQIYPPQASRPGDFKIPGL